MNTHNNITRPTYFVTGGAGFIGSALCRYLVKEANVRVVCFDKLTYAASPEGLNAVREDPNFVFVKGSIGDGELVGELLRLRRPDAVINLAAETHVDRSIDGPAAFMETNILGTFVLLQASLHYWQQLAGEKKDAFRFLHVSTDEVYGSLTDSGGAFLETTPYSPRSPYSASKASSDHLVNTWHHTYGLPILITNCSNNYGPYQFPEKLIPLAIVRAAQHQPIPVYGSGLQVRDWLFVDDHVRAIHAVLTKARPGSTYNVGGNSERRNIEVIHTLCDIIDEVGGGTAGRKGSRRDLITHVDDRPGHDFRYAIDSRKLREELNWKPRATFESGMRETVTWYLSHSNWWERILSDRYNTSRLGLAART